MIARKRRKILICTQAGTASDAIVPKVGLTQTRKYAQSVATCVEKSNYGPHAIDAMLSP